MSLINDVLRQVDDRNQIKDEMSSFFPVALIPQSNNRNVLRLVLIVMSALLILVYLFQLIMNKPLFRNSVIIPPTASSMSSANATRFDDVSKELFNLVATEDFYINLTLSSSEGLDGGIENILSENLYLDPETIYVSERLVAYVEPISSEQVISGHVNKSKVSETEVSKPQTAKPKPKPKPVQTQVIPAKVDTSVVKIPQDKTKAEKDYQRALGYFINGDIERSDSIIKHVLLTTSSEESLSLQARIFIEKKDADGFYSLVKKHPENNSLDWYKLIAPGLQLFSYYHLSNQYYYALISIEPDQIRWQLAVALNQIRLGKEDKAIAIYKELSQSAQVSGRQKQWLIRKIERLTLSKA